MSKKFIIELVLILLISLLSLSSYCQISQNLSTDKPDWFATVDVSKPGVFFTIYDENSEQSYEASLGLGFELSVFKIIDNDPNDGYDAVIGFSSSYLSFWNYEKREMSRANLIGLAVGLTDTDQIHYNFNVEYGWNRGYFKAGHKVNYLINDDLGKAFKSNSFGRNMTKGIRFGLTFEFGVVYLPPRPNLFAGVGISVNYKHKR